MRTLRSLHGLSLRQWVVLPQLAILALAARTGSRTIPLPTLLSWIETLSSTRAGARFPVGRGRLSWPELRTVVRLSTRVWSRSPTCYPQALIMTWLLASTETPSRFCIGVKTIDGSIRAHAWVEAEALDRDPADESFELLTEHRIVGRNEQ